MSSKEDIESFLLRSGTPHRSVDGEENMWLISDRASTEQIVVNLAKPLVLFRCKMMPIPEQKREALFSKLLELNTSALAHGSYGIDSEHIVLTCALQAENLDYNEFQAVIDDFSLALTNHYPILKDFHAK